MDPRVSLMHCEEVLPPNDLTSDKGPEFFVHTYHHFWVSTTGSVLWLFLMATI